MGFTRGTSYLRKSIFMTTSMQWPVGSQWFCGAAMALIEVVVLAAQIIFLDHMHAPARNLTIEQRPIIEISRPTEHSGLRDSGMNAWSGSFALRALTGVRLASRGSRQRIFLG